MLNFIKNKKGFTLIELTIAVSVFSLVMITGIRATGTYLNLYNTFNQTNTIDQQLGEIVKKGKINDELLNRDKNLIHTIKKGDSNIVITYKDLNGYTTSKELMVMILTQDGNYVKITEDYFKVLAANKNYQDLYIVEKDLDSFNNRILGKFNALTKVSNIEFLRYAYRNEITGFGIKVEYQDQSQTFTKFKII